jgi:hypothetical protein
LSGGSSEDSVFCQSLVAKKDVDDRGDIAGALNSILAEPPYGEGVDEAKVSLHLSSDAVILADGIEPHDERTTPNPELYKSVRYPKHLKRSRAGAAGPPHGLSVQGQLTGTC